MLAAFLVFPFTLARAQEVPYVVRPNADPCLNVRPEPSTDATPFDCIAPGTPVVVLESRPYWRRVRLPDGRIGWAAKKFLEPAPAPGVEPAPPGIPADAWLEVHFVDVGQGDGIWIHTFDDGLDGNGIFEGRNIVIDGGPDAADDKNAMLAYLKAAGHHGGIIDALILTHPHLDHYPGAEGLFRHFDVHAYYDPGYPKGGTAYPAFRDRVNEETSDGVPVVQHIGKDQLGTPDWGAELEATFLYAYPGDPAGLGSGNTLENNASIVLRLVYGSHTFLFMGDAEGKDRGESATTPRYVEKILLETVPPDKLKATVLKIAHHGSETSSTLPFLEAVDPEVVVVCSGRKSFSGTFLPDASVLARYCSHNPSVRIYRTDFNDAAEGRTTTDDADGDHVVIRTNGTTLEVQAFSNGQPMTSPPGCPP